MVQSPLKTYQYRSKNSHQKILPPPKKKDLLQLQSPIQSKLNIHLPKWKWAATDENISLDLENRTKATKNEVEEEMDYAKSCIKLKFTLCLDLLLDLLKLFSLLTCILESTSRKS